MYDLNSEEEPLLPVVIDMPVSPVYVTNTSGTETEEGRVSALSGEFESVAVESMRIGQQAQLHLGYSPDAVATGAVGLDVTNSMLVEGLLRLGKDSSYFTPGMPNGSSLESVWLNIGGDLTVANGGMVVATGAGDGNTEGGGEKQYSTVAANTVTLDGGSIVLDRFSTLSTGIANSDEDPEETRASNSDLYGITIRNGGMLKLNGGRPAEITSEGEEDSDGDDNKTRTPSRLPSRIAAGHSNAIYPENSSRAFLNSDGSDWEFKGVDVTASGRGILVDDGGMLSTGRAGGVIAGAAGQGLDVRSGGTLDVSEGSLIVTGIDSVAIDGAYRAGYDQASGTAARLVAPDAAVSFSERSGISLSRDLQRQLNANGSTSENSVIVEAASVQFINRVPIIESGMGTYGLEVDRNTDSDSEYLRVGWGSDRVVGNSSSADMEQFRSNMSRAWRENMKYDQAWNLYNMTAVTSPLVNADGESGRMNQSVLEALVDGNGAATANGSGFADRGISEMYNLSAQWGVNSAQLGTAEEFMGQLDRRTDRIGAEMDRLGLLPVESVDGVGYASIGLQPEYYVGRVWAGGFGRNEKAEFDLGSGYTYRLRGIAAGYDRDLGRFNVGVAGAFGKGDYEDTIALGNDSEITSYSAGLYGSYHGCGGLFASAQATYSHFDNDISDIRGGMNRQADHSGFAWTLGAKLGFDKLLADRVMVTPTIGVNRARSISRSHDEYLNGITVLNVGQTHRDSFNIPLELGLGVDLVRRPEAVLRLTGNAGYAYDFYDGSLDGLFNYTGLIGSTAMEASDRNPGRNRVNVGAGLQFTGRRLDFSTRYDYFHRSRQKTHQAQGSLGVKF